jgi:hypothetical protein
MANLPVINRRNNSVQAQVRAKPAESARLGAEVAAELAGVIRDSRFQGTLHLGHQWVIRQYHMGGVEYRNHGRPVTRQKLLGLNTTRSVVFETPESGDVLVENRAGYRDAARRTLKGVASGPLGSIRAASGIDHAVARQVCRTPATAQHFQELTAQLLSGALGKALESAGLPYAGTKLHALAQSSLPEAPGTPALG